VDKNYVKKLERHLKNQGIDISNNPHGFIFDVEQEIESYREKVELNEEIIVDRSFETNTVRFYCEFVEDEYRGVAREPYAINGVNIIKPNGTEIPLDFTYLDGL